MLKISVVAVAAAVLLSPSCGKKSGKKKEIFSYDLTENDCKTGPHSFSTLADMCRALDNDELNNNCASGLRASRFEQNNCAVLLGGPSTASPDKGAQVIANDGFTEYRNYFSSCSAAGEAMAKRFPELSKGNSKGKCPAQVLRNGRMHVIVAYCDYRDGRDYYYEPAAGDNTMAENKATCEEESEFVGKGVFVTL